MRKRENPILIIILILVLIVGTVSCSRYKRVSTEKQKKEFLQLQENREAAHAAKMEEARQKHLDIQTKETRKRMKRNRKKVERRQKGKPPRSFFQRLFTKKAH